MSSMAMRGGRVAAGSPAAVPRRVRPSPARPARTGVSGSSGSMPLGGELEANSSMVSVSSAAISENKPYYGMGNGAKQEDNGETAINVLNATTAVKQSVVHNALAFLMTSSGLERSAACLRKEAGLSQDPGIVSTSTALALAVERLHTEDARACEDQQQRVERLKHEMGTQRKRTEALANIIKGLRGQLDDAATKSSEEGAKRLREQQALKGAVELKRSEVERLRKQIAATDSSASNLTRELAATEDRLAKKKENPEEHAPKGEDMFDRLDENHDGKITREEFAHGVQAILAEARKIREILNTWEEKDGGGQDAAIVFRRVDNGDGRLEWENDEAKNYVSACYTKFGVALPPWSANVWYDLYNQAGIERSKALDVNEATRFLKHCLEMTLETCLRNPAVAKAFESPPPQPTTAEEWVRTYERHPATMGSITYRNGLTIDIMEVAASLQPLVLANAKHRPRMVKAIDAGTHMQAALQAYRSCDRDGNGFLTWNNSEIRNFMATVFRAHGLSAPVEDQMYGIYARFDMDNNCALDAIECMEMSDVMFRAVFVAEPNMKAMSQQVTREMGGFQYAPQGRVQPRALGAPQSYMVVQNDVGSPRGPAFSERSNIRAVSPTDPHYLTASMASAAVANAALSPPGSVTNLGLVQVTMPGQSSAILSPSAPVRLPTAQLGPVGARQKSMTSSVLQGTALYRATSGSPQQGIVRRGSGPTAMTTY